MLPGTLDPLVEPAPLLALLLSGSATFVIGLLGVFTRRRRSGPFPVAGLVIAGSATAVLFQVRNSAIAAVIGVGLLALGGLLSDFGLRSLPARVATALPGAWIIAFGSLPPESGWISWLFVLVIALGAPLVTDFGGDRSRAVWGPPLFAISALGVFLTVPDTEEASVLLAAAIPAALLGWPTRVAWLGGAGSFATVGIAAWVIAWGGIGREASLVGAVACLGLLLVEPMARLLTRRGTVLDRLPFGTPATVVTGAIHFLLVIFASRVAGLRTSIPEASVLAGSALFAGLLVVMLAKGDSIIRRVDGDR